MIAVIGDVHGCYHTLKELVQNIKDKYPGIPLYCVGDLVDRGKFSYESVEFVLNEQIRFTPGNHDFMFYYFIKDSTNEIGRAWLYNGYESTINSYHDRYTQMTEHLEYISRAPLFINLKDCFISHAGISKVYKSNFEKEFNGDINAMDDLINREKNSEHGILWTRDELLNIGKLQIVGHTRQRDVYYNKKNNSAYIDTSVYTGNKMSAVIIEDGKITDKLSVATKELDIFN